MCSGAVVGGGDGPGSLIWVFGEPFIIMEVGGTGFYVIPIAWASFDTTANCYAVFAFVVTPLSSPGEAVADCIPAS